MNSRRVGAIILRQLFLLRRNFTRFINIFLWVSLDVIIWGFTTKYLNDIGQTGFSFVPVFLGAVIFSLARARRVHINTAPGDLCWVSGSNEMVHDPPIPCQGADRPIARFVLRVSSMATLKACEVTARVAFAEGEELSIVHRLQVREMRGCCG